MKPLTGNSKVARMLMTPQDQRKGTVGFLIERWHRAAQAYSMLESETNRLEREAQEARTQLTKAHGALELVELMIAEHEETTPHPSPVAPQPDRPRLVPGAATQAAGTQGKEPDKNGGGEKP